MHLAVARRFAVYRNAQLFHHLAQLGVDILPFAHPQVIKVISTAQTAELIGRERLLLLAEVVPQVHEAQKIGLFIVEAAVFFIRRLLFIERTLARVLNRQRRGDYHRLAHAAMLLRLQHHARETRVHRQLRQLTAQRRQFIHRRLRVSRNRPQLFQQAHAVLNVALIRRFDKRERRDIAKAQRRHLQNNGRQVGAQDFRVGKFRAREEIIFRIETNTDAFRDAPAAPFTLVSGGLGHRLDRQTLHFGAVAVTADARRTGVYHIFNARHRQRGFRHVGRQHNASPRMRLEYPVLLAVGEARIKRQHLGVRQVELHQAVGGVTDFALAAHKNQDVARPFAAQLFHGVENRL
ncbi:putative periplasmic protein kinase ArgK and related GTPases of G3E family [Cronobacter turicensis 564]|nr:putative periplasmic protein kinase ArgK and related GTPases of G3E family [Cronobacter turicensis 564]